MVQAGIAQFFIITFYIAPSSPPRNLRGYNTSRTSIQIHWHDIIDKDWGGILGHFRVEIASLEQPEDKNVTNITR